MSLDDSLDATRDGSGGDHAAHDDDHAESCADLGCDLDERRLRGRRVELDVPNPKGRLRNGMYGRVTIVLDKAVDQYSIPSSCLVGRTRAGAR